MGGRRFDLNRKIGIQKNKGNCRKVDYKGNWKEKD